MFKGTGGASISDNVFFKMVMKGTTEEGNVAQKVEMVVKEVKIDCSMQEDGTKQGQKAGSYAWDIPGGKVS